MLCWSTLKEGWEQITNSLSTNFDKQQVAKKEWGNKWREMFTDISVGKDVSWGHGAKNLDPMGFLCSKTFEVLSEWASKIFKGRGGGGVIATWIWQKIFLTSLHSKPDKPKLILPKIYSMNLWNREEAQIIIFRLPRAPLTELFSELATYMWTAKKKTQFICRQKMDFAKKIKNYTRKENLTHFPKD